MKSVACLLLGWLLSGASPSAGLGQTPGEPDLFRFGITLGSTAFLGISMEYVRDQSAVELTLGTWALRDVSVSVVGKQYLGQGTVQGFVGLGLWNVTARQEEGIGSGLMLRAPVGFEVETFRRSDIGAELNVSRALWIHRADPEDDTPPASRIVPLPGFYLKWASVRD
ncbi:MAG: hypothetical protein R3E10_17170 [Gemmatimonadota bacterium]